MIFQLQRIFQFGLAGFLTVVLGLFLVGCSNPATPSDDSAHSHSEITQGQQISLGKFSLTVPDSWTIDTSISEIGNGMMSIPVARGVTAKPGNNETDQTLALISLSEKEGKTLQDAITMFAGLAGASVTQTEVNGHKVLAIDYSDGTDEIKALLVSEDNYLSGGAVAIAQTGSIADLTQYLDTFTIQ